MQDELLQFKLQKVRTLVDLPNGKSPIGTKWVLSNKKDERGIMIKNKARLVAQGYIQEERIVYDEMDVKSDFLYSNIKEEVYVCQPPGFEEPDFPDRVYKVEKALYGLHQAPRAWYETLSTYLLDNRFQRGKIDKTLFIKRDKDDILTASKAEGGQQAHLWKLKLLLKDEDGKEVDVHLYKSMIGSLMNLISSRPDIMFAVCACVRYQVNLKVSYLHAVKRIFRLISWQCKKQTMVANSTTEVEDCNEKKLIPMVKIHTNKNVADVLTKAFDVNDEEGMDCLPNATIFEELTRMGAKTTAWNEFSSTMASVINCLATNQKFNFSKYIFESMVKNLENVSDNVADKAVNEEMDDSLVVVPQAPNTMRDNNCTDSLRDSILNVPLIYCTQEVIATLKWEDRLKLQEIMELMYNLQSKEFLTENTKDVFKAQSIYKHGYAVSSLMDTAYWSSE
ncbi:retrovirus-related pol polyprotein from transposon TNT 1-94 [Tanacetum coccineum]